MGTLSLLTAATVSIRVEWRREEVSDCFEGVDLEVDCMSAAAELRFLRARAGCSSREEVSASPSLAISTSLPCTVTRFLVLRPDLTDSAGVPAPVADREGVTEAADCLLREDI